MNNKKPQILKSCLTEEISSLVLPSHSEHIITVHAKQDVPIQNSLSSALQERNAEVLNQFVFGGCQHYKKDESKCPTIWMQGDDVTHHEEILSLQVTAISGLELKPVILNGKTIGFFYEDEYARYCKLGSVFPEHLEDTREDQAASVFLAMSQALDQCGMQFTDIVRTWLYLDKLLDWYDEFNAVRTDVFEKTGIFDKMVPASTGIGAMNPFGAHIAACAFAVQPKNDQIKIERVKSPMQGSAEDYRSSFSRAVEIQYPEYRALYISGTASIDPEGNTVHLDDPNKQIELTMQVVEEILKSRNMTWSDASRGIAYFRNMKDYDFFTSYCRNNHIPCFPLAISQADVCRDDLLFELEVDGIAVS